VLLLDEMADWNVIVPQRRKIVMAVNRDCRLIRLCRTQYLKGNGDRAPTENRLSS
jgi:hypothetical protein